MVTTWQEGKNTIVVPDYVTDVNTVADLKGKAAQFDGRIVGIEAGAGEMKAMREKVIPAYGLDRLQPGRGQLARDARVARLRHQAEASRSS